MSACKHNTPFPDLHAVPTLQACIAACSLVDDDPHVAKLRAVTSKDGRTRIDRKFWNKLSDAQQAATVAHERAHAVIGLDIQCEGCADKVGGFMMRAWGFSPSIVSSSFASLNAPRGMQSGDDGQLIDMGAIGPNASAGVKHAERALASRGLLGRTPLDVSAALSRESAEKTVSLSREAERTPDTKTSQVAAATLSTVAKGTTAAVDLPVTDDDKPVSNISDAAPIDAARGNGSVRTTLPETTDPTKAAPSPVTSIADASPAVPVNDAIKATLPETAAPDAPEASDDLFGDALAAVFGEDARRHKVAIMVGAGAAAALALTLVIIAVSGRKGT